jgi:hypothetical protein
MRNGNKRNEYLISKKQQQNIKELIARKGNNNLGSNPFILFLN